MNAFKTQDAFFERVRVDHAYRSRLKTKYQFKGHDRIFEPHRIHLLREAVRSRRSSAVAEPVVAPRHTAYLRQGFLSNALNPKVALFFVTFLPQFLTPDGDSPRARAVLLSAVFAGLYLAWFSLYIAGIDQLGRWLRRPKVQARVEQVTGSVLVLAAARLLTTSH